MQEITSDGYEQPFDWSDAYPYEAPEDRLYGLLPCGWQCEQGFLPLPDGTMIQCAGCQEEP